MSSVAFTTDTGDERWDVRERGPADAGQTVLLLPGGLCTATFYDETMAAAPLAGAPVRLVAATLPGFGRTPHGTDLRVETYARLAGALAAELGADLVVGHSLGANVALEMAAAGDFGGPLLLLSPSFSRADEISALGAIDRIGRLPGLGRLAWLAMVRATPAAAKRSFPPARRDALAAEMKRNDPGFCRAIVRSYFEYLDRHGSVAARLCDSGARAHVVFGDRDEIGLTDAERARLDACANVDLITMDDASHMLLLEQPERTAELIAELLAADPRVRRKSVRSPARIPPAATAAISAAIALAP
jgi:pimeloyl-ACP methyl ester carboxylesterase